MVPWRTSTTKSEWLPEDPMAFVPTRLWKSPFITTWGDSRNQNHPTDSAEEDGTLMLIGAAGPFEISPLQLLSGRTAIKAWYSGTSIDSEHTLAFSVLTGDRSMTEAATS